MNNNEMMDNSLYNSNRKKLFGQEKVVVPGIQSTKKKQKRKELI